ncbi:hypothetical protein [Brevibacillus parabrevis]|uniref:hypothetical protein n=1 Tax=Brevibacillus parabrevis TaxID=54914 RepID=UPI000AFD34A5|nr:hypothetical protein [Brevibacillus parabrevis]
MKKKQQEQEVIMYPKASEVFVDERLACYFRPLLTFSHTHEGNAARQSASASCRS